MKIRELFLASCMTVAFGCPGDDSGDDSNTSSNASTGQQMNTTGEQESSGGNETTGGGGESTTGGGGGESTTDGGGESSSGGDSSGGGNAECQAFCEGFFTTCGESPDNDYGDQGGCENACAGFSESGFACRQMHLELAGGDPGTHCVHASSTGGGVCTD